MVRTPSIITLSIMNASDNLSVVLPAAVCSLVADLGAIILNWTGPKWWTFKLISSVLLIWTTTLLSFWIIQEEDAALLEQKWQRQQKPSQG